MLAAGWRRCGGLGERARDVMLFSKGRDRYLVSCSLLCRWPVNHPNALHSIETNDEHMQVGSQSRIGVPRLPSPSSSSQDCDVESQGDIPPLSRSLCLLQVLPLTTPYGQKLLPAPQSPQYGTTSNNFTSP
jgi:hypothetical protein